MADYLIEKLYSDNKALSDYLLSQGQLSFWADVDNNFKKVLLLAVASYLEKQITEILTDFSSQASSNCDPLVNFVQNKAIKKQYHTFFNWETKNVNNFLGLFGDSFKAQCVSDINTDNNLNDGVKAFLEIGSQRNYLVHENYAAYYLEKTSDEIFELYKKSQAFIDYLKRKFTEFI